MSCTTGFKFSDCGLVNIDFDDIYVRKEAFSEGGLWIWGAGGFGQLGTNDTVNRSSPVQTVSGGANWKQVSLGAEHSAAIKTDGTLWMWGANGFARLGDNTAIDRSSPVQTISGGTNWYQVDTSALHTGAIKTDGTLWMWGYAFNGRLGTDDNTTVGSPRQTISGGYNWYQVSTGCGHTAAIKTDGTLWMWGCGTRGDLGDNNLISRSSPVQTISGGTNWKQVSLGGCHTGAIKTDGTLWLWGKNSEGHLGDNTIINRSSPVQTISGGTNWKQVEFGINYSAAIKTDGTLWLWGCNVAGELGTNNRINQSSPIQTITGGTNWKQVSLGDERTAAIKTDGTLWSWGRGNCGIHGNNSTINQSSPVQTVSGGTNWRKVSVAGLTSFNGQAAAIREDCW